MYHFPFETAFIVWLEKPSYLALAKEAEFKRKEKKYFNKQYFGVPFVTCYLLNSVNQHAALMHNSVTVLSCTSKHFKWEEAPACRYCLSSSISTSLWADSIQGKPPSRWKPTGSSRQKADLSVVRLEEWVRVEGQPAMEGSVGVRVGTRTRVGCQALAHLLGLGPERAGCREYRSRQGRLTRGLLYLKLLAGLGRLLNTEGHGALNIHNPLKLSLSSHSWVCVTNI